ncbi:glycine zipper 2TM domain-containing protein [Methylomarinum vadi]|uniref:glycine zipper 2TM domain-containing protein n=1 Tax=Methylomarinum vadi TaxID=438855 RepID=UPI0004DF1846|nr:glycine zipper 2TM domain-containing protein [Methylomarinum vadi]
MYKLVSIVIMALLLSTTANAHDRRGYPGRGHAYGHYKRHHHDHRYRRYDYRPVERIYYREEVRYAPRPPARYYPAPRYRRYDNRSAEGLVGGAFGSIIGYEIGRGDPLAAGVGAALGSFVGNEIRR